MPRMKEHELIAIVGTELNESYGASSGELSDQIATALDYYYGEPFGNEEEGQSQVVSTDVRDVIGWQVPSLMRIFTSTNRAVVFDPVQPEDEDQARQETDIVNHVFFKENDGYLILHDSITDGLLSKNGIAKVWWDSTPTKTREEYKRLTDIELQALLFDEVEPIEHTESQIDGIAVHDIAVERVLSDGRAKIEVIAPEEFRISKDAVSIDPKKARFTCHITRKTRSDLIEMGFSKRKVNSLAIWNKQFETDIEESRRNLDDDTFMTEAAHESMQQVEINECYIRVDFDGDGIAELRQVTFAGNEILVNEPVDSVPFVAWTPRMLTHKFFGMSSADDTMELQLIKSTLLRQILDNTYQANNGRTAVQDGQVNLDDLLTSRPGGVVRTLGPPGNVISPMPYNPLPQQTGDVMGMMDQLRKERTGVSQETMGLEANVLAHGRTGVINQSFDVSQMKIELIARNYAEVFLKPLFRDLHEILQKNQTKKKWIQLRGEWIEINPSEWRTRYNMTVNVGLGTGNKDKQLQGIAAILSAQKELIPTGRGVTEDNIFNALEKLVEFSGFNDVNQFFTDPSTQPPPQPKTDPQEQLAQAQIQLTQQQVNNTRIEAETNRQEAIWRHEEKMKELIEKDQRERYKIELEFQRNVPGGLEAV